MNAADRETLIEDLLGEGGAGLKAQVLLQVRWRRRRRRAAPAAALVLTALILGGLGRLFPPHRLQAVAPVSSYMLIRTSPLSAAAVVETRPTWPATVIESERFAGTVSTCFGGYRLLADGELLRLVVPRSGVLVRAGSTERLIFPDPRDARGFPLN